jgi:hypothetical protein
MFQLRARGFRSVTVAGLITGIAVAIVGGFAAQATAGTYSARFCAAGPGSGDRGPFDRFGNESVFTLADACGGANGLRVSHNGGTPATEGAVGRFLAERPAGISVQSIAYQARGERAGGYFPQVVGTTSGDVVGIINGDQELDGSFKDFSVSGDVRRFGIQLICQTGKSGCGPDPSSPPSAALKDVTYTLSDLAPPAVSATGGSLFEGAVQTGAQTVGFDATDSGSGVRRVLVEVNGKQAGAEGGSCRLADGVGLSFQPCPASKSGSIKVDTTAKPWRNGRNSVRVCVEDLSSDSRRCTPSAKVLVLNGCATNAAAATTMSLGWRGKRGVVRSRQGRARTALVKLFGGGRVPVSGASVCFSRGIPTDRTGAERVLNGAAVTGADGAAAVKVRGQSSRFIRATYFAGPEQVMTKRIRLNVSPAIRLGIRRTGKVEKGDTIRAVAVLRGKYKAQRRVCFYASRPGRDKFACDTTGTGGRARVRYEAEKAGKLRIYAKVPNQRAYPYSRGRSVTKVVRVR